MTHALAEQLADQLDADALRAVADEHDIELQTDSEMGMVQDLIAQAANEGFDPSDQSVDELRAFIQENLDPSEDAMAAFDDIADAVLEAEEADSEDVVAAEDMADWIAEQMQGNGGENEGEGEDENEGGDEDMEMADRVESLAERVEAIEAALEGAELATLQETVTTLSEAVDARAQAERVDDLAEDVTALQETVEEIASNLEESSTLADIGGAEGNGAEDDRAVRSTLGDTNAVNRTY